MARTGDVVAEFGNCFSESFSLTRHLFEIENYKMCKDDTKNSLFSSVSNCLESNQIMNDKFSEDKVYETRNQTPELSTISNNMLSLIEKQSENALDNCMFSSWTKNTEMQNFLGQDLSKSDSNAHSSFINNITFSSDSSSQSKNSFSLSKIVNSDSILDTSGCLLQSNGDLNTSGVKDIFCSQTSKALPKNCSSQNYSGQVPVIAEIKKGNEERCFPFNDERSGFDKKLAQTRNESLMPELVPTLICLDDDDEESCHKEEKREVVNLADSPEMPKLVPFSSETAEVLRIKKEKVEDDLPKATLGDLLDENLKKYNDLLSCTRNLFPNMDVSTKQCNSKAQTIGQSTCNQTKTNSRKTSPVTASSFCSVSQTTSNDKRLDSVLSASENNPTDGEEISSRTKISGCVSRSISIDSNSTNEDNHIQQSDPSCQSANECKGNNLQPQVVLRRISVDHCLSLNNFEKHGSTKRISSIVGARKKLSFENCLSSTASGNNLPNSPQSEENKNSSSEAPEIEEIEGVRFFQFRSKSDMEEFNRKPLDLDSDMDMIIPTKTTDITLIKGWRNKYFASDLDILEQNVDNENNASESKDLPQEQQCDNESKNEEQNVENKTQSTLNENSVDKDIEILTDDCGKSPMSFKKELNPDLACDIPSTSDMEEKPPSNSKLEESKFEKCVETSTMSAFVSKELDDFLLNSSVLNVDYLQKLNPNITPIPPDASILSLGKLRKDEKNAHTLADLKRDFYSKFKEGLKIPKQSLVKPPSLNESVEIVEVLSSSETDSCDSSSSSSSSSEEDIPVATLNAMKLKSHHLVNRTKGIKRMKSDVGSDEGEPKVVLRLAKNAKETFENNHASGVSTEQQSSSSSSSSSESEEELPPPFRMPVDGSLPTIKHTVFLKETEPKVMEEFLNNLNMYGTSMDVAMLMQSNQSYFEPSPLLTAESCTEALEALMSNKEFLELKSKQTPKKKLKAWQKYLPKKSNIPKHKNLAVKTFETQDSKIKSSLPETFDRLPHCDIKSDQDIDAKSKLQIKKKSNTMDLKNLETNEKPKVKRKRKSNADFLDKPFVTASKRKIRLPSRYLDSVLLPDSEWMTSVVTLDSPADSLDIPIKAEESPSVTNDPQVVKQNSPGNTCQSRKDLLDVLSYISPKTQEEISKVCSTASNDVAFKRKDKAFNKGLKPPGKKKAKLVKESGELKTGELTSELDHNYRMPSDLDSRPNYNDLKLGYDPLYSSKICSCSPCSRTVNFQKAEKNFSCFSAHLLNIKLENQDNNEQFEGSATFSTNALLSADVQDNANEVTCVDNVVKSPALVSSQSNQSSPVISSVYSTSKNSNAGLSSSEANNLQTGSSETILNNPLAINLTSKKSKKLVFLMPMKTAQTSNSPIQTISVPTVTNTTQQKPSLLSGNSTIRSASPQLMPKPLIVSSTVTTTQKPEGFTAIPFRLKLGGENSQISASTPGTSSVSNSSLVQSILSNLHPDSPHLMVPQKLKKTFLESKVIQDSYNSVKNSFVVSSVDSKSIADGESALANKKKGSDRRRKSPLKPRTGCESDPEDLNVVGEFFDGLSVLKRQNTSEKLSDDDDDISSLFLSSLDSLKSHPYGTQRSVDEKRRRLFLKKMFHSLTETLPGEHIPHNSLETLRKAVYIINKLKRKERSLQISKRILSLHNAQLLEKLCSSLQGIKDAPTRKELKNVVIRKVARDWHNHNETEHDPFLVVPSSKRKRDSIEQQGHSRMSEEEDEILVSSEEEDPSTVFDTVKQRFQKSLKRSKQLPANVPKLQTEVVPDNANVHFVEQPHVQLRILESSPTAQNNTPFSFLGYEDTVSQSSTSVVKESHQDVEKTVEKQPIHKHPSGMAETTLYKNNKVEKILLLEKPSSNKTEKISSPNDKPKAPESDNKTKDHVIPAIPEDDTLVIDLSDDDSLEEGELPPSPKRVVVTPPQQVVVLPTPTIVDTTSKQVASPPKQTVVKKAVINKVSNEVNKPAPAKPLKKFPGIRPLNPESLLCTEKLPATPPKRSSNSPCSKMMAERTLIPGLLALSPDCLDDILVLMS